MKHTSQNLKKLNLKNLAFISIAAFVLAFGACNADIDKPNTNPLTDKKIQMDCFADKSARNDDLLRLVFSVIAKKAVFYQRITIY